MPQNLGPTPSNGQFYPGAIQGNLFRGGNQAPVATAMTAGLPTAYTGGLVLSNPLASAVNLVIQKADVAFTGTQTNHAVIGIGTGHSATPLSGTLTAVPVQTAVGGLLATPSGALYSSASITLPVAPVLSIVVGAVNSGAATVNGAAMHADIEGALVIPPGGFAAFTSTAAGTASSFMGSLTWTELSAGATA